MLADNPIVEVLGLYGLALVLLWPATLLIGGALIYVLVRCWRKRVVRYLILAFFLLSLASLPCLVITALASAPHG